MPAKKKPLKWTVEVACVSTAPSAICSEDETHHFVTGARPHSIYVAKDGELQFSIGITDTGSVHFNDHSGMGFRIPVHSLHLIPSRPWEGEAP